MIRFLHISLCMLTACAMFSTAAAAPIAGVQEGVPGFVGMSEFGPLDEATLVLSISDFQTQFGASTAGLSNPYLAPSVAAFFHNGGSRMWVVRVAASDDATMIGVDGGTAATRTGLQALANIDELSTIAIPGASSLGIHAAMLLHCTNMGDRIALLDPAIGDDPNAVVARRAALVSSAGRAAFYFPWVQGNPTGPSLTLPPSGYIAGVYAATATPSSPIAALNTATGLSYAVSTADIDLINPLGINPIRDLGVSGIRVWGARTIASNPEYKFVAVRRMADHIYESVDEGTAWALSEPNAFPLWSALDNDVSVFLGGLFAAGWFQGQTAGEAYFVSVGLGLSMTQLDIDEGRTIVALGFAPVRPAEFLVLSVVQQRTPATAVDSRLSDRFELLPASPNPANPSTAIRFRLDEPTAVRLQVYDVAGRLVRTLLENEPRSAGEQSVDWNGRDDRGTQLASGVYMLRLEAAGLVQTDRVSLLK